MGGGGAYSSASRSRWCCSAADDLPGTARADEPGTVGLQPQHSRGWRGHHEGPESAGPSVSRCTVPGLRLHSAAFVDHPMAPVASGCAAPGASGDGDWNRLPFDPERGASKLTHYMFRYPAKFHPPVAAALLEQFTKPGDRVFDPFAGSGTLLVEGAIRDRRCFGMDVDPVAVAVARAKTRRYDVEELAKISTRLLRALEQFDRGADEYARLAHCDIRAEEASSIIDAEGLWIPAIPNLHHWFRRYVVVDLARILRQIERRNTTSIGREFLRVVFASIIRNASNADPVPVSGLEVTAHMRRLDERGRVVDPFALLRKSLKQALAAVADWSRALDDRSSPEVFLGDATQMHACLPRKVDAIITSPPYHNAVDYYRRHQLEMFWLKATLSQADRLELLPRYIGRPRIRASHPLLAEECLLGSLAAHWEQRIADVDQQRARDFRHYLLSMSKVMRQLARHTDPGAPVVMVVGQSAWNGTRIPTVQLLQEIAQPWFSACPSLWYPVRNRYMSYARQNGANIDREYVVVLQRTAKIV